MNQTTETAITCPKCGKMHKYSYTGNIDPWWKECKKLEKHQGWGSILMPNGSRQVVCKDCKTGQLPVKKV